MHKNESLQEWIIILSPDVLDGIAHPGVVIEGWNLKLPRELAFQNIFREGESSICWRKGH